MTSHTPEPPASASWPALVHVVLAGVFAALHVGKATIALPQLQTAFDRSLASLGGILSAFPLVGVFGGIAAGLLVRRWGDRRLLMAGLGVMSAASVAGAFARSFDGLLVSRCVEGLGFVVVVVAAPAVLNRLAPPARRGVVFGLWSTFMAGGMALSTQVGPHLGGWRTVWLVCAALTLGVALLLPLSTPRGPAMPVRLAEVAPALRAVLTRRATLLLALGFAAYTLQFFSVMSFLPVFLMQRLAIPVGTAGALSAVIVALNAVGNLFAGALLARGIRPARLLVATSIAMGGTGAAIFVSGMPALLAVLLCGGFSAISGMLPTTVLATTPGTAPSPSLAPLSLGLVMQGNYLGQVLGPLLVGALASAAGWPAVAYLVAAAAAIGVLAGTGLRSSPRDDA